MIVQKRHHRCGVAQLVEQRNHNPCVNGSSPFSAINSGCGGTGRHASFRAMFCEECEFESHEPDDFLRFFGVNPLTNRVYLSILPNVVDTSG